jgi:predicted DNA-binding transcriptional regulator YafY
LRHEKAEVIHRIALDMRGTAEGLSIEEIRTRYASGKKPLSRRTAERLRDAVDRVFSIEHANPGELPKRWRIRGSIATALANVTAGDLADLATAAAVLRRENMMANARSLDSLAAKLRAHMNAATLTRVEPDFEVLTEAEGLAMRPGPRQLIDQKILVDLRHAILAMKKVRLHYRYRSSGKRGFDTIRPYGFLYGNRHYLVAWSENEWARDFRNFALSNIERIELLDKSFARDRTFSLKGYAAESFGVFREKPFAVELKFTPAAAHDAKEYLFHLSQTMQEQPDGSLIVRFRAGGALEMAWHLFTWGSAVTVVKPKRLSGILRANRSIDHANHVAIHKSDGPKHPRPREGTQAR